MVINYSKLKTNLNLAKYRLKILIKRKAELNRKARKDVIECIQGGKYEHARIRVEQIIREDYLLEAMEIVEMYCNLLMTRFSLIKQIKQPDEGLMEPVTSLIWATSHMQTEIVELKVIRNLLTDKFGKSFVEGAQVDTFKSVNQKLNKLILQSPPKDLIEKYLIEISKVLNVHYQANEAVPSEQLLDFLSSFKSINETMKPSSPPPSSPELMSQPVPPPRKRKSPRPIGFDAGSSSFSDYIPPPSYESTVGSPDINFPSVPDSILDQNEDNKRDKENEQFIDFNDIQRRFANLKNKK